MTLAKRRVLLEFGMWTDLAVCGTSLLLASAVLNRPLWQIDALLLRHPLPQLILALALGAAWHISLLKARLYESYRLSGLRRQTVALIKGTTAATLCTCVWLSLSRRDSEISANSFLLEILIFWCLSSIGLLATRVTARVVTGILRRHGRNLRNVLIIGSNRRAVAIAENLLEHVTLGYHLLGFVDDLWHHDDAPIQYKEMLLGPSQSIPDLLRELALDEVIITLPIASHYELTRNIISHCQQQGILVRCEGSLFDSPARRGKNPPLQLITLHDETRDVWGAFLKRTIDFVVSGAVIAATLPVMLGIALAIKLTSDGPVFFKQERLGLGKRRFRIFKFRTMVVNAEALMKQVEHLNETSGPTFKLKHDPRITPIGSFLRKTSLDELPQLLNVFLGDMSLVGPRPLPLRDYQGFSEDWHRRRFSVKPGITCLWQVSGRSSIGFERWMELDMDYIDRWSLWLDLEILMRTIPAVVRGSGAV